MRQFLFKLFFKEEYERLECAETNFERLCGQIESGTLTVNPSKVKSCTALDYDISEWDTSKVTSFNILESLLKAEALPHDKT